MFPFFAWPNFEAGLGVEVLRVVAGEAVLAAIVRLDLVVGCSAVGRDVGGVGEGCGWESGDGGRPVDAFTGEVRLRFSLGLRNMFPYFNSRHPALRAG